MYITDWQRANEGFLESIDVQSNVLFLILTLIIIVAVFNVVSGMVMMVSDKSKEIAILRTIGMKKKSIIRIFMISGFSTGFFGTLLGFILGLSFAHNIDDIRLWLESFSNTNLFSAEIYFLSKLPAEVRFVDVFVIVTMSLFLSLCSTIYPAYKAAKIEPAEALKF
jgi:lipoprotein-releasing system permease protein